MNILSITWKIEEQVVEKPTIKQFLLLFWTFGCTEMSEVEKDDREVPASMMLNGKGTG